MQGELEFNEDAWNAFARAAQCARELGHGYCDTEHILIGLLKTVPDLFGSSAQIAELQSLVTGMMEPAGLARGGGELPYRPAATQLIMQIMTHGPSLVRPQDLALALAEGPGIAGDVLRSTGQADQLRKNFGL